MVGNLIRIVVEKHIIYFINEELIKTTNNISNRMVIIKKRGN